MDSERFESSWSQLSSEPLDEKWFHSLRGLYRECSAEQHDELRRRLGWSQSDCVAPADPFAADFSERLRQWFGSVSDFLEHFTPRMRQTWENDDRDFLVGLGGMYHLLIIAGMDPDDVLRMVIADSPTRMGSAIASFLNRDDKWQLVRAFQAIRLPNGHVRIQATGL